MKICIELDKEMSDEWEAVKEEFEGTFKWFHQRTVSLTDLGVLKGLLFSFEISLSRAADAEFAAQFSDEDIETMYERASQRHSFSNSS